MGSILFSLSLLIFVDIRFGNLHSVYVVRMKTKISVFIAIATILNTIIIIFFISRIIIMINIARTSSLSTVSL